MATKRSEPSTDESLEDLNARAATAGAAATTAEARTAAANTVEPAATPDS